MVCSGHLIAKEDVNGEASEAEEGGGAGVGASSAARRLADNHQLITEMRALFLSCFASLLLSCC